MVIVSKIYVAAEWLADSGLNRKIQNMLATKGFQTRDISLKNYVKNGLFTTKVTHLPFSLKGDAPKSRKGMYIVHICRTGLNSPFWEFSLCWQTLTKPKDL